MMWWPLPRYSIWLLLILSLAGLVAVTTLSLIGCNPQNNFDIVQNQQPSLTCTGLGPGHNFYWSITDPSNNITIIANCSRCNVRCPPCSQVEEGFNVSRESNASTTLQFLDHSQITDGSTIKCCSSQTMQDCEKTCKLHVISAYTIPECKENAINIEDGQQKSITCQGLVAAQNMYWTITYGNGTVSTVAECKACANSQGCLECQVTHSDFTVTREDNSSTLVIQSNIEQKDDTTLRCSKKDNVTHDDCTLCVKRETFNLLECSRNSAKNFDIVLNQQPSLTCTGLTAGHNIYWSITDLSGKKEIRIGECGNCGESCPPCLSPVEGYIVSRQEENTTLQFLNPAQITDRWRIKCSSVNNCSEEMCNIFVVPAYRIPTCRAGAITVVENKTSPIVCEGLLSAQSIYWTITYGNRTVSNVAECEYCRQNTTTCPLCVIKDTDFSVTRERNSSTLLIQNNTRQKDGATLTCSKRDNATQDDCTIHVMSRDYNIAASKGLPVAAVAGSAAGFVVIVAVVIVIAVFVNRKRSKRGGPKERQTTVPLDDEFEEHINEFYQSADDSDLPRHSPPKSPEPLSLDNPSVDAQGVGSDAPQNHVYAQVNKGKKEKPDVSKEQPGTTQDVKQHAEGGKIQKPADKGGNEGPLSEGAVYNECVSDSKEDNSATDVYVNVDQSPPLCIDQDTQAAKKDSGNDPDPNTYYNTETILTRGDYTNVQPELNDQRG